MRDKKFDEFIKITSSFPNFSSFIKFYSDSGIIKHILTPKTLFFLHFVEHIGEKLTVTKYRWLDAYAIFIQKYTLHQ